MSTSLAAAEDRIFSGKRGILLAVIIFANFVYWLDVAKFSLLDPFWSADLHLTTSQISSVVASYLLGYFPLLFIAGIICDRFGARNVLAVGLAGVTVMSATMAFVHTYDEMYIRNLIFGVFFGCSWAPSQRMLSMYFPGKNLARATALWMGATMIAGCIAPAIALPIANHFNWRDAFLVVAALGIPAFILMVTLVSDKPERLHGISQAEVDMIRGLHQQEQANAVKEKISFRELLRALKRPSIWTMVIATGLGTTPTWLSGPWTPYGLITLQKVNPDTIAWVSPLLAAVPVAYSIFHGSIVKHTFGGRTRPWLIIGPLCGAAGYAFGFIFANSYWVAWAFMITAFAFLCDPMFWGTVNSYWNGIARPEVSGTLNGIAAALQVGVGWYIVNQSGKWVGTGSGRSSLNLVWIIGAIMFAATVIPVLLSKEVRISVAYTKPSIDEIPVGRGSESTGMVS